MKHGVETMDYRQLHDEMVKKSHERSEKYGIEKERVVPRKVLTKEQISRHLRANKEFIRVAAPFMKILYDFLKGSGFILVLTDKDGCILSLFGDREIVMLAKELNMVVGAYMDEGSIGTNAMGTAIEEDSPIQLSSKEHFITAYHKWTCSAAPIHDVDGSIVGSLNLTGTRNLIHPHTLGLVVAAVKSIEYQINNKRTHEKLYESYGYLHTVMNSISNPILTVSRDGMVQSMNETACGILNMNEKDMIHKSVECLIGDWKEILDALKSNKSHENKEVSLLVDGKKKRFNMDVYPIKSEAEEVTGMVIMLKDMQKVFNLVNQYTGMHARYSFDNIIYQSRTMKNVVELAKSVASSPSTILIEGESGTGKEVLAQSIHNYSNRRDFGFVAINCGAIPKNLIESELFGYDDGAFTGGKRGGNPGKFELANGGTIFLDEIGEMPLEMQVNLLRVLQEGCITRVGGNKYIPVDVRVIAATNKNLRKEVEKGSFRKDLYYRLSVIPIHLPTLRERREDIPLLIQYLLNNKLTKLNKGEVKIPSDTYEQMLQYNWPGNIRELENFIEKIVNFNGDNIPMLMNEGYETSKSMVNESACEKRMLTLEETERRAIIECMEVFQGNVSKVARSLGIGRNTLYSKMKKYHIQ